MTKIPSDEEFASAKQRMRNLDRNMDQVNERARDFVRSLCADCFYDLFVLAEGERRFRAYIFYRREVDVGICEGNGVSERIRDFIFSELERCDRGRRDEIALAFEFDSDENVAANYDGDYFVRLR